MTAIPQYMIYFLGPFMLAWLIGRKRRPFRTITSPVQKRWCWRNA